MTLEKEISSITSIVFIEYIKDIPNGPKRTLAQFDDYLYRWAEKVWPRALDIIHALDIIPRKMKQYYIKRLIVFAFDVLLQNQ